MKLFEVYPLLDIEPIKAKGAYIYDRENNKYLDFYGGHAVISIGHNHPHYVHKLTEQLQRIGYYSNSVLNALQEEFAHKLGEISGLQNYELFLCNSGAEANENALKMASFNRPKTNKVLILKDAFHGRTSAAVNVTDNTKLKSCINRHIEIEYIDNSHIELTVQSILKNNVTAVILEAIQGIGGLSIISEKNLIAISKACKATQTILIMDEIQCGYGRSGKFFAYQFTDIEADIITIAKGMGNGFPMAGVLLNNQVFKAKQGQLGTTFGGNHLACAAGIAVLDVIKNEKLISSIEAKSEKIVQILQDLPAVTKVVGKGLMLGAVFTFPVASFRTLLAKRFKLMTGNSKDPNMLRILPPLTVSEQDIKLFKLKINSALSYYMKQAKVKSPL